MIYDSIIIGQGLAGSCLSWQLLNRGKRIIVFDEPDRNRSTSVAAGLVNPIAGQWMLKTWLADSIFPYLHTFYTSIEETSHSKLFLAMPIYRPFSSVEEQNEWMGKSAGDSMKPYVENVFTSSRFGDEAHDDFGGVYIAMGGIVDANMFGKVVRERLQSSESYRAERFDIGGLVIEDDVIHYKGLQARNIVFSEGVDAVKNTYFNWLPFRPLKGETMDVAINRKLKLIFNKGVYIVPTWEEGVYKVGATYNRESTAGVSDKGQEELEKKLNELLNLPYEVRSRNWGIRPAIDDRRPVIGAHPVFRNVYIFNGLGTKGVSLAPYFSGLMADWIEGKAILEKEVNVDRYKSLYSKS